MTALMYQHPCLAAGTGSSGVFGTSWGAAAAVYIGLGVLPAEAEGS